MLLMMRQANPVDSGNQPGSIAAFHLTRLEKTATTYSSDMMVITVILNRGTVLSTSVPINNKLNLRELGEQPHPLSSGDDTEAPFDKGALALAIQLLIAFSVIFEWRKS
jgi:hypothetical protein